MTQTFPSEPEINEFDYQYEKVEPMTLAEILVYLDKERGHFLIERGNYEKGCYAYNQFSSILRVLNRVKKEIHNLQELYDADIPF